MSESLIGDRHHSELIEDFTETLSSVCHPSAYLSSGNIRDILAEASPLCRVIEYVSFTVTDHFTSVEPQPPSNEEKVSDLYVNN